MKIFKSSLLVFIISALALIGCGNSPEKTEKVSKSSTVAIIDTDKDGVPDSVDKDNSTPMGAHVDDEGVAIDSDKDGIPDGIDKEIYTTIGAKIDSDGVAIDSDKDGVPDGLDKDDSTPMGTKVNEDGVALDSDKDGVQDGMDKQENTPTGAKVDADGVALDSDKDGVPDGIDKDDSTPMGAKVNADGIVADTDMDGLPDFIDADPAVSIAQTVEANGRQFFIIMNSLTSDLAFLSKDITYKLDTVAKVAIKNGFKLDVVIAIQSTGDKDSDLARSASRISAVKQFLTDNNVNEKDIIISSKIETISLDKKLEKIKVVFSKK